MAAASIHPALAAAWSALDVAAVPWGPLRGDAAGDQANVDLLGDPSVGRLLGRALESAGFVRLPAIGCGDHRFNWLAGLWHRLRGRLVVYDRHALDALMGRNRRMPKGRIRRWILSHAVPEPALVLIFEAPAEFLFARKGEHDPIILDEQRQGYLRLATRLSGAEIVNASRDADAVRRDVTARTRRRLSRGYHDG